MRMSTVSMSWFVLRVSDVRLLSLYVICNHLFALYKFILIQNTFSFLFCPIAQSHTAILSNKHYPTCKNTGRFPCWLDSGLTTRPRPSNPRYANLLPWRSKTFLPLELLRSLSSTSHPRCFSPLSPVLSIHGHPMTYLKSEIHVTLRKLLKIRFTTVIDWKQQISDDIVLTRPKTRRS